MSCLYHLYLSVVQKHLIRLVYPSIHPSSTTYSGQQSKQWTPDCPRPLHVFQLIQGAHQVYPRQFRDITSLVSPGAAPGSPPSRTCLKDLTYEALKSVGSTTLSGSFQWRSSISEGDPLHDFPLVGSPKANWTWARGQTKKNSDNRYDD